MRFTLILLMTALFSFETAAAQTIGLFDGRSDIGPVKHGGTAAYDAAKQTYTITGSGTNMWGKQDEFHMVWKQMKGDFILTANATFPGKGVDPHRKYGWIVRKGLQADAPYVDVAVHGDGLTSMQFRRTAGAETEEVKSGVTAPATFQLSRIGGVYKMSVARAGEAFTADSLVGVDLGDEVFVGLFVCSHNADVVEKAVFHNVRITIPAPTTLVPYREFLGSRLEVVDVQTGHRRVLHWSPGSLQAPNWTPDGKHLIYNHNGLLYRFEIATGRISILDTGFANNNNNDHVLSFDGKQMGISHQSDDHNGQSIVYTVPIEGGTPKLVTDKGPSYLHGWSPDAKYLIYTAERNGDYDIYRISVNGGAEEQLTKSPGLDDGSEYSPDGRYIYFNSVRSGLMQLWRMRPDGSNPEQLTKDEYNNWFPHVSPDGKQLVFISYGQDVRPSDHPFYKHVMLRTVPANGGTPKVLAYLYGGQGTINVPSWSPDSRYVAFVSNTK